MVTWIIRQPISPQLHVYKPTSQTSRSSELHFTIHTTLHFVSCSQLLTLVNQQAGLIGRPKGVKKLDGLDGLDSLCEVGDEAVDFAVKAISRYFSGVRV